MELKDKLMTLEDFKAVRDVDVASNTAQFTEIKADLGNSVGQFRETLDMSLYGILGSVAVGSVGETIDIDSDYTYNSSWKYVLLSCKKGDVFAVKGRGGNGARLWACLDEDYKVLSREDASVTISTPKEIRIEEDGYFLCNHNTLQDFSLTKTTYSDIYNKTDAIQQSVDLKLEEVKKADDAVSVQHKSRNYFDKTNAEQRTMGLANVWISPQVVVEAGETFYPSYSASTSGLMTATNFQLVWLYDVFGNVLQPDIAGSSPAFSSYTIPSGIVKARFGISAISNISRLMVEKNIQTLEYEEYYDTFYDNSAENKTELVMPEFLCAVTGIEFNLYKDNALLYGTIDSVTAVKFMDYPAGYFEDYRRYRCLATSERDSIPQISLYKYNLIHRDSFKNVPFHIRNANSVNGLTRNIMILGDSKVAGARLPKVFKEDCANNGMIVGKLVGSIYSTPYDINHEGRAGWSAVDYVTLDEKGSGDNVVTNPFYHNNAFDFSYYMESQNVSGLDYIFINLGTNDYAVQSGIGSRAYIDSFISAINTMISSIHAYNANIKIVIGITEGVCTYQWSSGSAEELRRLNTRARLLNKASLAEWDNSAHRNNNIFICPIYLSMDMDNDYVATDVPLSQRDEILNTGKTRRAVTDTMHQNSVGYSKNADYMFATLCYIESLS